MSDHKPECPMLDQQWPKHPLEVCEYCDMISACEQRVLDAINLPAANAQFQKVGYADGLDAAREAVGTMVIETVGNSAATVEQALSVIDALREKP